MQGLYNLGVRCYGLSIVVASLFNEKARLWRQGRCGQFERMSQLKPQEHRVWMHCASLGEYEQGRPVLEALKKADPQRKIVVTFFSPSGYEKKKKDTVIDEAFYLPLDTPSNARKTVQYIHPDLVIFVKYEYWFNTIQEIHKQEIPMVFISVLMRENHFLLKNYAGWFRRKLAAIDTFFVQDENSAQLFRQMGLSQVTVSGDTRYDRVAQIASHKSIIPEIEHFKGSKRLWLIGSSWPQDEVLIKEVFQKISETYQLVIAPHEIHEARISQIEKTFSNYRCLRYTEYQPEKAESAQVLIINTIGILSKSYYHADVAYVGGAFGKGLHNILE